MQLTLALVGLLALGTNAATINTRQDPVLFTYQVEQGGNCSTIDWNLSDFHQSQLPASKCVVISDLVGSAPATAFILVETQGICRGTYPLNRALLPPHYVDTYPCYSRTLRQCELLWSR